MDPVVYLVPVGRERFELYSEPADESAAAAAGDGFVQRRLQRWRERWRDAVQSARQGNPAGAVARVRDWFVSRIAETLAEQRTLWLLRSLSSVDLRYPGDLDEKGALAAARRLLSHARRHHLLWLIVDGFLFAASGVFVLVPGPNILAYYFGFRVLGHFLAWRGARNGLDRVEWRPSAEAVLAELGELAAAPRAARATRVAAIAGGLKVPRLAAFFDRVAS